MLPDGSSYIEATLDDIAAANRLAHEVLGRSLDELPPQTRRLLGLLQAQVQRECNEKQMEQSEFYFSRRDVRRWTGWSQTQIRVHLDRLVELEYLLPHRGTRGQSFVYELLFDGEASSGHPQLAGLIEVETLGYDAKLAGANGKMAGKEANNAPPKRPQNGGMAGSKRVAQTPAKQHQQRLYKLKPKNVAEIASAQKMCVAVS